MTVDRAAYSHTYRMDCLRIDSGWVQAQLAKLPDQFASPIYQNYEHLLFSDQFFYDGDARQAANLHVLKRTQQLTDLGIDLATSDEDLCEKAKDTVKQIRTLSALYTQDQSSPVADFDVILRQLEPFLAKRDVYLPNAVNIPSDFAIVLPTPNPALNITLQSLYNRLTCESFWRRVFRTAITRKGEAESIRCGLVHQGHHLYISEDTLSRKRSQRQRNKALLDSLIVMNELGDTFSLLELAAVSVSNPVIRRAELMTRIVGFEAIARSLGHVGLFLTITCPSRFHSHKKLNQHTAIPNPRYDGSTPRQAQAYLSQVYAQIRAALHRQHIKPYGFRICEPHHDGCPHWHFLIFVEEAHQASLLHHFQSYSCRSDHQELVNGTKARFEIVEIDWSRGTAAGYVAKYVCKNIDGLKENGESIGQNFDGMDTVTAAERVLAWASTWGIRQFQQIGVAPVTLWRELRRIATQSGPIDSVMIDEAANAADTGDWAAFVRLLGGTGLKLADLPIRISRETGLTNRYGEHTTVRVLGVVDTDNGLLENSRFHSWTVKTKTDMPTGGASHTWTRVNNCTPSPSCQANPPDTPFSIQDHPFDHAHYGRCYS